MQSKYLPDVDWEAGFVGALPGDIVWGHLSLGKAPGVTLTALPSQLSVKKLWLLQRIISKPVHATKIKE